jgi:hypothetical protein
MIPRPLLNAGAAPEWPKKFVRGVIMSIITKIHAITVAAAITYVCGIVEE